MVNALNTMQRILLAGACSLFLLATEASAQRYTIRRPPDLLNEFSVGVSMLTPADVEFANLGRILGRYNYEGAYDDFAMGDDSVGDSDTPDGKTYYFVYNGSEQVTNAAGDPAFNGTYIKASAAKAEPVDGIFSENMDSGSRMGTEWEYIRYFDRSRKLGALVAFSLNGFDLDRSATWDVNISARQALYLAENVAGRDGFSGTYIRPRIFSPNEPETYVYQSDPIELSDVDMGTGEATGYWDVKTCFATLRLGGVYNLTLSRRFLVRVGGGLSLVMANSRFRWTESYTIGYDWGDYELSESSSDYESHLLYGGWADMSARFRISRSLTMFGSMQYQGTTSFEQETIREHKIEFDSGSQFYAKTGFSWSF
jgi:hypothetical protein